MSIMRVIFTGTMLAQRFQNVLHFENPDGALNHQAVRDELMTNWIPRLRNLQNASFSWVECSVQTVSSPPDVATVFPLAGQVGSLAGAPAVTVIAALFSVRTALPGRTGHGRFYMPGVHGESVANSVVQSGALAAFQGEANFLVGRYGAAGTSSLRFGVFPRGSTSTGDFKTCTAIVVRPVFGIQRRRNIGVGG